MHSDPGEIKENAAVWDEGIGKVSNCLDDLSNRRCKSDFSDVFVKELWPGFHN